MHRVRKMARKGAGDADLKEFAQCDCAAATSHNHTNPRAKQNGSSYLVSLTTLLPMSQCVRGEDVPMDMSTALQCNTPGSLIPARLTHNFCSLQPSLHTAPTMFCTPSLPILLLERRRTVRPHAPEDNMTLTRSAVSAVSSLSVRSRYLEGRTRMNCAQMLMIEGELRSTRVERQSC